MTEYRLQTDPSNPQDAMDLPGDAAALGAMEPSPDSVEQTTRHRGGFARWLIETIIMIGLAFLLAQGIKTFVVQPFVIPTGSMEPTIMAGDRVLAEKMSYRFSDISVGDIVVFDDPTGRHPQLIKRVIALGGQTVDIENGIVLVDGVALDEQYLHGVSTDVGNIMLPLTLAADELWLMGDNRPNSGDSRFMGAVPAELVQGRGFAIYWPMNRIGALR